MWDSSFWETTLGLRCLTGSSGQHDIYGESQLCEGSGLSGFCQTLFFSENGWLNDEVGEGMVGTGALIGHVFLRDQSRL